MTFFDSVDRVRELIPAYVAGALGPGMRAWIEDQLENDSGLQRECAELLVIERAFKDMERHAEIDLDAAFAIVRARVHREETPSRRTSIAWLSAVRRFVRAVCRDRLLRDLKPVPRRRSLNE